MPLRGKYEVKLGRSFVEPPQSTFMTMRCDFLPASVDKNQAGTISITNDKEVGIRLPSVNGTEPNSTLFKGNIRPVHKECLLIYNKNTGELILERISKAAQLKKVRDDQASKKAESHQSLAATGAGASAVDHHSSIANQRAKPRTMSESSSDEPTPRGKEATSQMPTSKSKRSPALPSPVQQFVPTKTSTLSLPSSVSSDSDSHRAVSPDRSSLSSLGSLDLPDAPLSSRKGGVSSVSPSKTGKQAQSAGSANSAKSNSFSLHRDIIENDLHLSESDDSDEC
ncbi:hypothetical protein AAHC03_017192 [Spirometra sp. Aus1]